MSMKITLSAAMRARDVSRPRPEQLTEAAAGEPQATADDDARAARRDAAPGAPGAPGAPDAAPDAAPPRSRR